MSNLQMNNILKRTVQYLSSKQCANGGFCVYKTEYLEEPNPTDTFFAVSSFQLLGEVIPNRDRVLSYLRQALTNLKKQFPLSTDTQSNIHNTFAFNYLYFPFYTLNRMGCLYLDEFWRDVLNRLEILLPEEVYANESGATQQWLLRKVRTKKFAGEIPNHQQVIDFILDLQNDGGFGVKPNLIDTYWSVALLKEMDYDLTQMDSTRQFIQRLQTPQSGFTLTEDGLMTSLEVIYAGVFASLILHMEIPYIEAALQFVQMCQMDRGGFARMPVGLPDIESTYRALKVLKTCTN
ncbi:prenyltransferase/squalene oxidase repeat-containing protein [Leptodesmis sichuanensis]|uniref:prenyltransferase/squalene oxidase repeat-containing protein n=1 Tax=Leptodesmis sichuanensis TaxID=2906798 RepID=UPI001F1A3626|nr:prenyltransferase/squalene oxidase repeat-containing protein [Leptodesmis sichuanensis]UIE36550.1 hypothetical protein KIK02_16045 [Leptodesmis sichuanensis A121]